MMFQRKLMKNGVILNPKVMDVKPVLSSPDTDILHGHVQHGHIYIPSSRGLPSIVSTSVPSVDSQPSNPGQDANIFLLSLSPQSSQPKYYQQQQPQLVTTVTTPQYVFDEILDVGDQIREEHKLQRSQFGSQAVLLDFECEQSMPSVPHSALDPVVTLAFENEANAVSTCQVQVLSMSVNPSLYIASSFVTAARSKSIDARDYGDKSCKKDVPTNQSIGLARDITDRMDKKIAILPVNDRIDPQMPMHLISCDLKSNIWQDVSESHNNEMPLAMSSTIIVEMSEVDATSEVVNSNLVEESVEYFSDDYEEIFIERDKRKSKSYHSSLPAPKRVCGEASSGVVGNPRGTSSESEESEDT
ncbi:uncharacterized protein LOC127846496 isoform X2 [Dreissena polymorpha]|uniref:Uncharacterized protein n=1 Tax=Dreissena polymorpha TaxID=45954 RepID=A0A9D4E4T5_DREPO|nr:uncharacterized protein LOC127846496 isoform X2 [Dreissena polymorpha]KAH3773138.1 hypothetical protein DPMN_174493 [Dreissena polymorpha]